jgi:rhomboid protease GluP
LSEQPCAFHPNVLTAVTCSNCGRPICPKDMFDAPVGIRCPICAGKMREGPLGRTGYRVRAGTERLPGARRLGSAQLTSVLIAANVVIFVLMQLHGAPSSKETLLRFGALPGELPSSEWWRLITAMFVHIGIAHLFFNMFALFIFGVSVEQRYGKARFLGLYFASGVLGSAWSLALGHAVVSAGASGAIFGIMGAWAGIIAFHHNLPGMRGQLRSILFLIGINIYVSIATPGIDLWAHVGGLVGGFTIAIMLELAGRFRGHARTTVATSGYLIVALVVYLIAASHMV